MGTAFSADAVAPLGIEDITLRRRSEPVNEIVVPLLLENQIIAPLYQMHDVGISACLGGPGRPEMLEESPALVQSVCGNHDIVKDHDVFSGLVVNYTKVLDLLLGHLPFNAIGVQRRLQEGRIYFDYPNGCAVGVWHPYDSHGGRNVDCEVDCKVD